MGLNIALGFFIVAIVAVIALFVYAKFYIDDIDNYDKIYPNVYIAGVDVGGMTKEEALDAVNNVVANSYSVNTLTVQLPDRVLSFTPEQTNVSLNADEAIEKAYAYGRDGSKVDRRNAYNAALENKVYIELDTALVIDYDYIRQLIDVTAASVESDAKPSTYEIVSDQIIIQVGYSSKHLDADGLYDLVMEAFNTNDFKTINYDYEIAAPKGVDLDSIYAEVYTESKNASYDPATGQITPEVVGYGFDLESAKQHLTLAEEGSQYVITIETVLPEITAGSLSSVLFRDVLGSHSTSLAGSTYNRSNNCSLACKAVDGKVLQPGETFSFNNIVGERTVAKGYAEGTVYVGGQSAQEVGGGICQVASTIYYVSLLSNLEIVERTEHQFVVTYLDLGMDATVYYGSLDFKFRNDTDYPLRINANVSNGMVNVTITGTNVSGNYVKMTNEILSTNPYTYETQEDSSKPAGYSEVKQTGYTGYSVKAYRNVYDASGNLLNTTLENSSSYKRRNHVTIIGTGGAATEEPTASPTESPTEGTETAEPTESSPAATDAAAPTTPVETTAPSVEPSVQPSVWEPDPQVPTDNPV